jgi:lysophospholipase L1-like esterase
MNSVADAGIGGSTGSGGRGNGAGGSIDGGAGDGPRGGASGDRPDGMGADLSTEAGSRPDGGTDARVDGGADARADGALAYSPCPAGGAACIIMPLGDSITDGFPFENGSYRVELFHQAVQGATPITFVGRNLNGPASVDTLTFPRGHEGYSGFTIDSGPGHSGISPLVDGAISMFHPHIVLLHIGTNDINGNIDLANAPMRLGTLIDRINTDAPAALVVVAQIIPTTNDGTNARIRAYNDAIPALVQQRAAAGKHVMVLDMYGTFTSHADYKTALMTDSLHPSVAGYATMGDAWYAAISALLPRR